MEVIFYVVIKFIIFDLDDTLYQDGFFCEKWFGRNVSKLFREISVFKQERYGAYLLMLLIFRRQETCI